MRPLSKIKKCKYASLQNHSIQITQTVAWLINQYIFKFQIKPT